MAIPEILPPIRGAGPGGGQRRRAGLPGLVVSSFALVLLALSPRASAEPVVRVERLAGGAVEISVRQLVPAPAARVWATLTDYDRLAQFIPGLRESRVVSHPEETLRVRQLGETRILWFRFRIAVTFEVEAEPMREIRFRGIDGDLQDMTGRYRLEPQGDGVLLRYEARFRPAFPVPPLIGPATVAVAVRREFQALVEEIARRGRRPGSGAPGP